MKIVTTALLFHILINNLAVSFQNYVKDYKIFILNIYIKPKIKYAQSMLK